MGVVTALSDGVSVLSASRNGITAVTALRVGELGLPTNDAEFNMALVESNGLNVYPQAVTLVEGVKRKILVGINEVIDSPDLRTALSGTRYFVSNSDIITVSEDGLITALDEGVANVTVIHGASEYVLPVRVEIPHLNSAVLGKDGGAVQATDGSMVMVAPGALKENATVSITTLDASTLPLSVLDDKFAFAGAFKLDVGKEQLNVPTQLAIPNTYGIEAGKEVFFMRQIMAPDDTGALQPSWIIDDSGVVGDDGMIRTSSPPWAGAVVSGTYTVAVPLFRYAVAGAITQLGTSVTASTAIAASGATQLALRAPGLSGVYVGLALGIGFGLLLSAAVLQTIAKTTLICIPTIGLPYQISDRVSLNLEQVTSKMTAVVQLDPPAIESRIIPVVESVALDFDRTGAFLQVDGQNFGDSIENLKIDLQYGLKTYELKDISIKSNSQLLLRLPDYIPYSKDVTISLRRKLSGVEDDLTNPIPIPIPLTDCFEVAVAANPFSDTVKIINAHDPEAVIAQESVADLLLASISVGDLSKQDRPRYVATTSNASLAYVPLMGTGEISVVDLRGLRPLDVNPNEDGIQSIKLRNAAGTALADIVIHPNNKYAYVADRNQGQIFVLDINPYSRSFNQHVSTIQLSDAPKGIRQMAMNSDGTRLFVTSATSTRANKGSISVININPNDPYRVLHTVMGTIETSAGVEGISATPYANQMIFTNRLNDAEGFGVLTIDNEPGQFKATTKYTKLLLGSEQDAFDVNEAVAVTMMRDPDSGEEYAFVAGRNGRLFGSGIPSIDGVGSGSNVGVIINPLGENSKLVAATRPISMGLTNDLVVTSDNRYLYATYPGISSTLLYDVREIIQTIKDTSAAELNKKSLDNINSKVAVAAPWGESQQIGAGVSIGLSIASDKPLINLNEPTATGVYNIDTLLPTFRWNFDGETTNSSDVCSNPDSNDIKEVNLYVSVFKEGEGLLPSDNWGKLDLIGLADTNPNRILTAKWKNGVWTWVGGSRSGNNNVFTLPSDRILTAGQKYYWAVEAITNKGKEYIVRDGEFRTRLAQLPSSDAFSNVTILTRGSEASSMSEVIDNQLLATAKRIAQLYDSNIPEAERGLVLLYDRETGGWKNQRNNSFITTSDLQANLGKPLVLLPGWDIQLSKTAFNSGFSEAFSDTLFASLVNLNQTLDRNQLFNSRTHFVGYGQGAVINSEIIQRLGSFFPKDRYSSFFPDLQMTMVDPHDFQQNSLDRSLWNLNEPGIRVWNNVTYADNYYQNVGTGGKTRNGREIIGADRNTNIGGRANFTPDNGQGAAHKQALTWYAGTVDLNEDMLPAPEDTSSFLDDFIPFVYQGNRVYRRLGDLEPSQRSANSDLTWYSPDYTGYQYVHGAQNAPWEGIGTGWFYSALGGGIDRRVYDVNGSKLSKEQLGDFDQYLRNNRTKLTEDNTALARMRGDYAVPTLFNGNFDAVTNKFEVQEIPGWSFYNGENDASQRHLVRWEDINSLAQYRQAVNYNPAQTNYALKLGDGLNEITHNRFVVPDWGALRLDVHVPVPSRLDDMDDYIQVYLETDTKTYNLRSQQIHPNTIIPGDQINQELPAVDLREVHPEAFSDPIVGVAVPFERIQSQLNRIGFGTRGFETFQVDVPDEVRGKTAKLKISLHGDTPVYIDNVFFKSKHLQFGSPVLNGQEARQDEGFSQLNNFLIEKPQFALSYNESLKTPNWVSYQLNRLWNEGPNGNVSRKEVGDPFVADYSLPSPPLTRVPGSSDVKYDVFQRGHMTRAEDRSRLVESYYPDSQTNEHYKIYKDYKLTYLMTNMVPQNIVEKGVDPWGQLEIFLSDTLVTDKGKELYIIAGRDGERKTFTAPIDGVNANISAPSHVWKVFLVLNPGEGIADVTKDTVAFAVDIPNFSQVDIERGTPGAPSTLSKDWKKSVVSINDLEAVTGYNFFNNIPTDIQETIESNTDINKLLNLPTARLTAEQEPSSIFQKLEPGSFINTSIRQPQVPNKGIMDSEYRFSVSRSIQTSLNQNSFFQISEEQVGISQSSFGQISSPHIGFTQVNITPISSIQTGTVQVGIAQIDIDQGTRNHRSSGQSSFAQVTSVNANTVEISTAQINSSQINIFKDLGRTQFNSSEVTLSSSITLQQLFSLHNLTLASTNTYKDNPLHLWQLLFDPTFNINLEIKDLPTGQLAEAQITNYDSLGRPNGGTLLIDTDANGVGWFIDTTPWENSEFSQTLTDSAFRATTGVAALKYDLLTTILHEMGHLVGIINGNPGFDRYVQTVDGKRTFVGTDFTATLTPDGSHLDSKVHPYDLMNNTLAPSVRKLPSWLNLQMINAIRSTTVAPSTITQLKAPLSSILLAEITNGNFDQTDRSKPEFGWSTRGAATILNKEAVLTEDSPSGFATLLMPGNPSTASGSPFNSNFSQSFIIPEGAKYLQFTLKNTTLGQDTPLAPGDAFEVALLDTLTKQSLVNTLTGLSKTDSLLNIQHDGTAYTSRVGTVKQLLRG
ncbi:hypothetical protein NUACC21_17570 [Scytonema sp. NUACC21]